jgi:hypothetical protein
LKRARAGLGPRSTSVRLRMRTMLSTSRAVRRDACTPGTACAGRETDDRSRPPPAGSYWSASESAAWAFSARSTPARDSETSRRRAALGSAVASQASVLSRVSRETWSEG